MDFRTAVVILASYITDPFSLIAAADAIVAAVPNTGAPVPNSHEARVFAALSNKKTMDFMRASQKINAIKELRMVANCGLKEAKDAVEDDRVILASGYQNPYS